MNGIDILAFAAAHPWVGIAAVIAYAVVQGASILDEELPEATDQSSGFYKSLRGVIHFVDNPTVLRYLRLLMPAAKVPGIGTSTTDIVKAGK